MDVLNKAYGLTGMQYTLKGIDRTVNSAWANGDDQSNMKKQLRKGDYKTLNLYYMDKITTPGLPPEALILGQCTFPVTVTEKSDDFFDDGCRMLKLTLPGGTIPGTGKATFEGKTTVHEVGHWNGLFHTFMGGSARDTCQNSTGPSIAGVDAIHNYMNYYDDSCLDQFTPGQIQHLQNMWGKFRKSSNVYA
ncbi:hypothetical protein HRG_004141 [Hirsutella rhossiliensis]|uniref:Peptidase M43 pregnancy-associated plasma-A domain-containing protein n=1 Tax=Hirsutella rhossiliensis TaxID=111463 RepID=A0A9P8SLT6_9HYPO|nr:uncharacterized protein HRG_04141 [Hirsutella rhossiliensis]KAH0966125.1 hypothetical protein HRG_04141 [Hirsutella rhossiliensis]